MFNSAEQIAAETEKQQIWDSPGLTRCASSAPTQFRVKQCEEQKKNLLSDLKNPNNPNYDPRAFQRMQREELRKQGAAAPKKRKDEKREARKLAQQLSAGGRVSQINIIIR